MTVEQWQETTAVAQPTAPAAAFRCSQCQTPNPAGRKFCVNCGQPLWEHCVECGAVASAGEKFCGACGVDLIQAVQERIRRCQTILQETRHLEASSLYDEALAMLGVAARETHWQLREYAQQAEQMIARVVRHRHARLAEADTVNLKAREYAQAGHYDQALAVLVAVPEPLRNDAMRKFVDEVRERLDRITLLEREIREMLAARDSLGVLDGVGKLLAIKPGHAGARQLSGRLVGGVYQAARRKLQECQYDEAVRLLAHVPEGLRTKDTEQLAAEARELAWLAWDLRTAPVVDKTLLAIGQRLCRLSPGDQRAAKLRGELERRAQRMEKEPGRVVTWAAQPEVTALGCPVEQLARFQRISFADGLERSVLDQHAGRFFSAYGLALQGIEEAAIRTSLSCDDGVGLFERMARLVRSPTPRAAWGIDLGRGALKAIKLVVEPPDETIVVADCYLQEHRKPLGEAINKAEEQSILDQALADFVQRNDVKASRISVGLPRDMVFVYQFHLPPMPEDKLENAIEYEMRHHGLGRPDLLDWDYQVLNESGDEPPPEGFDVLLVASKQVPLDSHLEKFERAGLRVDVAQSDCLAVYNAIRYDRSCFGSDTRSNPADASQAIVVLDVGSDSSSIIVGCDGRIHFWEIGFGSHSITKAVAREYQLGFARAKQLKLHPESADRLSQLYEAVAPVLTGISEEFRRLLDARAKLASPQRIERVLGIGGGFQFHGLWSSLLTGRSGPTA